MTLSFRIVAIVLIAEYVVQCNAFHTSHVHLQPYYQKSTTTILSIASADEILSTTGRRLPIDENMKGLEQIHANPDIYIIHKFLPNQACDDIITKAKEKKLQLSPVAYAGWTQDIVDLLGLAAKGPVAWFAIIGAWLQIRGAPAEEATQVQLVLHALQNYALLFVIAAAGILAFTKNRADNLQSLRTSTSTTLDKLDDNTSGTFQFVTRAAELFTPSKDDDDDETSWKQENAKYFEAPTVIRYEKGQSLAPHYDANRSAATEDANRGGQTLATLIVYLNDVKEGGNTCFGKLSSSSSTKELGLTVQAEKGSALLFFPADDNGIFDPRLEHEGCEAIDEKFIARIWRHIDPVPPPFGLTDDALSKL